MNVLAYADDIVLLSPSWRSMQSLINILNQAANSIDMTCNINKTVVMVFEPRERRWSLGKSFPEFKLDNKCIQFVSNFKYLGHVITNNQYDDDINRELCNIFFRVNVLSRKFSKCTQNVKTVLFKAYCLCFYDIALWKKFNKVSINKFRSSYNRCCKIFFGYRRRDSLTQLLLTCQIPSFDTVIFNAKTIFDLCRRRCDNPLVKCFLT